MTVFAKSSWSAELPEAPVEEAFPDNEEPVSLSRDRCLLMEELVGGVPTRNDRGMIWVISEMVAALE